MTLYSKDGKLLKDCNSKLMRFCSNLCLPDARVTAKFTYDPLADQFYIFDSRPTYPNFEEYRGFGAMAGEYEYTAIVTNDCIRPPIGQFNRSVISTVQFRNHNHPTVWRNQSLEADFNVGASVYARFFTTSVYMGTWGDYSPIMQHATAYLNHRQFYSTGCKYWYLLPGVSSEFDIITDTVERTWVDAYGNIVAKCTLNIEVEEL